MATSQNYTVNMQFQADTSRLQQQLQNLKVSLTKLATLDTNKLGISQELKNASIAAKELKAHLAKAMNPQTGNLDLSKLNNNQ